MKSINVLDKLEKSSFDLWHYKIVDEPIDKDDYVEMEIFNSSVSAPFEIYEDKLRTIEAENLAHSIFIVNDEEKKEIITMAKLPVRVDKVFVGNYNKKLKAEIEEYVVENKLGHMRRVENMLSIQIENSLILGHINFYDFNHTLGFYYSRVGLLRGCYKDSYLENFNQSQFGGKLSDFRKVGKYLDKDYIRLLYGKEGVKKVTDYYNTNFIANFEYGKSFLKMS